MDAVGVWVLMFVVVTAVSCWLASIAGGRERGSAKWGLLGPAGWVVAGSRGASRRERRIIEKLEQVEERVAAADSAEPGEAPDGAVEKRRRKNAEGRADRKARRPICPRCRRPAARAAKRPGASVRCVNPACRHRWTPRSSRESSKGDDADQAE